MVQQRIEKVTVCLAMLAVAAVATGCFRVHVDKDADGKEKNVQVDTPFGGVHVNTNQTTASDLGLPAYPGAHLVSDDVKHKSADVHLGFGEWELRVRAVSYGTADTQDQVSAFYKKALNHFGDVITCQGHSPVGTPTATSQGLTCADDGKGANVKIDRSDYGGDDSSVELKAGSKRHQHIVGFEHSKDGETRFALVALDLPAGAVEGSGKSD
ncbi:MAG: hypothetical protein ABSF17_13715 [Terracidiphilus sp.]|jgi:hypothetical protein